jgi:hypothetical protein
LRRRSRGGERLIHTLFNISLHISTTIIERKTSTLLIFFIKIHSERSLDCMFPFVYDATRRKSGLFVHNFFCFDCTKSANRMCHLIIATLGSPRLKLKTIICDSLRNCWAALPLVFNNLSRLFHLAASNFAQRPTESDSTAMINVVCKARNSLFLPVQVSLYQKRLAFTTPTVEQATVYVQQVERRVAANIDLYCNLFATLFYLSHVAESTD